MKDTKEILSSSEMFSFSFEKWKEQIEKTMKHPYVQEFRKMYPGVPEQTLTSTATRFQSAIIEYENCSSCKEMQFDKSLSEYDKLVYRLNNCPNAKKGERFDIRSNESNRIEELTKQCEFDLNLRMLQKENRLIKAVNTPKKMLNINLEDIDPQSSREPALAAVFEFIKDMKTTGKADGLYLHGDFGVGKSYLVAFAAKTLATEGIETTIVYVPEFFREIKASITDGTIEDKIQFAKETPILVLDDICAEQLSAWLRDEVLGPILQHRYTNELPTLFTSNCDKSELEIHLTHVTRKANDSYGITPEMESRKAKRILQRIEFTTKFVEVVGVNLRAKYK
ncbi:prepilin peptidase [Bacillus toyonensis]|uniref:primosomal protein DnaI n=1 Tax=Bacillus cereus group TaxID=86661 RepID=UPI000BF7405C|nr:MULTISPECIES: primosomal protein DnaI [Bacillus cereus group]PEQ70116.1 prepilin peptidase [Bacillus thuringiensis]PHD31543.1 prepilin peptidase [Bacillus toyonensis]